MSEKDGLKLCTLSGTAAVGRNANFIEYNDQILIVDFGFGFPGEELPGIDYLLPNFNYLKENKEKIIGILITHGHLDHTGGLPWLLPELDFPKVFAGRFATALIEKRLKEYELDEQSEVIKVRRGDKLTIGDFKASFIGVTHSIPHAFSIFVESPEGNVFFSGDYKIDRAPINEPETDYDALKALQGKVDIALMESTNSNKEGKAKSGEEIEANIKSIVENHDGRVVIAAFSSILSRIYSIMRVAQETGRKICVTGRSLNDSVRIAQEQHYIDIPRSLIISEKELKKYQDDQILLLCTGSQAERYGALNRISLGEHKYFKVKEGDLIALAASEIPGNSHKISRMTDRLIKQGADLVQNDTERIHESGHGLKEDMKIMYEMVKPKEIIPVHGDMTMRYKNKKNYIEWGMDEDKVHLTEDGQLWNVKDGKVTRDRSIESKAILVDGLGVGDIGDIVIRDRLQLGEFGMVTVVINLSSKNKKIIGYPKFVSRGFVYVKHSQELMDSMQNLIYDIHNTWHQKAQKHGKFQTYRLRNEIEKRLGGYIYQKTKREPMILPVIM